MQHVLVYGADPEHPSLLALCRSVDERNLADADVLQRHLIAAGFRLPGIDAIERPPRVADIGAALGRANDLPDRAPDDDDESAGMRYILTRLSGMYCPPGVEEIVAVARETGGVAVLAHPGRSKGVYAIPATAEDIAVMAEVGLDVHLQETFSDVVKTDKTGLSKTAHTRWMISAFANFLPGSTIFRLA